MPPKRLEAPRNVKRRNTESSILHQLFNYPYAVVEGRILTNVHNQWQSTRQCIPAKTLRSHCRASICRVTVFQYR